MIPEEIRQKPLEYLVLLLIFAFSCLGFFFFSFDAHSRRRVVYLTAAAYFFWSLYHHYRRGDLHPSIIVEYLLMSLLGILLISTTVF